MALPEKRKPSSLAERLDAILDVLDRAYPMPKRKSWPKTRRWLKLLFQYLGIPAMLLAAVVPVWEVSKQIVDNSRRIYIRDKHFEYASLVAENKDFDRALKILDRLEGISSFDAQAQYRVAKFLAQTEYYRGGNYREAEDAVRLLIILNRDSPFWFPSFGTNSEIQDLHILLNEIRIQGARFQEALNAVRELRGELPQELKEKYENVLNLQKGVSLVYMHRPVEGDRILESLINDPNTSQTLRGRAIHALGTSKVFQGLIDEGESLLERAIEIFDELGDDFLKVRSIANLGLVYGARRDWEAVSIVRREQESLARRIGDQRMLMNALIGLAVSERNLGDLDTAMAFATEAEEAAKKQNNGVAMAAALQNQANIHVRRQAYGKALYAAKTALPYFLEERDLRGVRATLGVVARAGRELGDDAEMVFGYFGALSILKTMAGVGNVSAERDLRIYEGHLNDVFDRYERGEFEKILAKIQPRIRQLERKLGFDLETRAYFSYPDR